MELYCSVYGLVLVFLVLGVQNCILSTLAVNNKGTVGYITAQGRDDLGNMEGLCSSILGLPEVARPTWEEPMDDTPQLSSTNHTCQMSLSLKDGVLGTIKSTSMIHLLLHFSFNLNPQHTIIVW